MPNTSLADLPAQVALALSLASDHTGTDYNYLLNTARSESSFQTTAKAPTSSAQGLFQFIEETWIRTIKDEGERFGLGKYADKITKTANGRYVCATPADRSAILALRKDPKISAMMAGVYAQRNAEIIENGIGRRPTSEELYIAHFLGPADAVRLISLRDRQPALSAPDVFPSAARANRTIFYGANGPRSVGQVYELLAAKQQRGGGEDPGPVFTGSIDFGTWSPTIEKQMDAKARPKPKTASLEGMSLFDYLAGKTAEPEPEPEEEPAMAENGWGANVQAGDQPMVPYITVADDRMPGTVGDGPLTSLMGRSEAAEPFAEVANAADIPMPALAAAAPEGPRLKIIRVAKK